MKITSEVSPVTTGGQVTAPKQFQINATKEAFQILSSGLYNDKISAIIRELACNAYDSHVQTGKKDTAFKIHLPTQWEPFFSVKDFGVGLSDKEIHDLYTTYFGTNRNNSNDFVGALGLGSKSPFSYTKIFSVTSRHQGKTRDYSAALDDGLPTIRQLGDEVDSTEPDGLTIKFAVEPDDIHEFQNKAASVFEFWTPLPQFNMKVEIKKNKYSFKASSGKWGLREEGYNYGIRARAIQGMVPYSVGVIEESKLTQEQLSLIRMPIDMFFDIGDLSVAASRETLSNDTRTVDNLIKALQGVVSSLVEDVKKKIDACKVLWEARLLMFNLQNTGLSNILVRPISEGKFNCQYTNFVFSHDTDILESNYREILFSYFRRNDRGVYATKGRHSHATQTATSRLGFEVDPTIGFIINDLGFGGGKYVNYFLQESDDYGKIKKVYFLEKANAYTDQVSFLRASMKFIEEVGKPSFLLTSDLQKKYRPELDKKKSPVSYVKKGIQTFRTEAGLCRTKSGYEQKRWREAWEEALNVPSGTKYFVRTKRGSPVNGMFEFADELQAFIRIVRESGLFDFTDETELYGVPNDLVLGSSQWVDFTPYVFESLIQQMTPQKELELNLHLHPYSAGWNNLLDKIADSKPLHSDSPIQKFAIELAGAQKELTESEPKIAALSKLLKMAERLKLYTMTKVVSFDEKVQPLLKIYPILKVVSTYIHDPRDIQLVIDYCKMIDERSRISA